MLFTISRTVTLITAFSVMNKPKKSRKKAELSRDNTTPGTHLEMDIL
jgi:hypothetical protein